MIFANLIYFYLSRLSLLSAFFNDLSALAKSKESYLFGSWTILRALSFFNVILSLSNSEECSKASQRITTLSFLTCNVAPLTAKNSLWFSTTILKVEISIKETKG